MVQQGAASRSQATVGAAVKTRTRRRTPTPRVIHPHAGGLDVGARYVHAAAPPDGDSPCVAVFGTFTADLFRLAAWFKEHGVTSVAMESTGSFWIPVFQILERCGLEVILVNARHVKNVPGRKTDVSDCRWLQYLHSVGLLQGSFRPPAEICAVRSIMRHRANLVADGAEHIQHMQKSLTEMGLQIHHVLSDLSGVSGLAIIDAILAGERDPKVLAQLRDRRTKGQEETVRAARIGDYLAEPVFTLGQAREAYRFCGEQLRDCDAAIERLLAQLTSQMAPALAPPPPAKGTSHPPRKGEIALPTLDLRTELYRLSGTDVTQIPGLGASSACMLLA